MGEPILNDNDHEVYCSTCGSCGEPGCCPPTKCKYGLSYINGLNKEIISLQEDLEKCRKTLAHYIKRAGYEPSENIIDQEIKFYGSK